MKRRRKPGTKLSRAVRATHKVWRAEARNHYRLRRELIEYRDRLRHVPVSPETMARLNNVLVLLALLREELAEDERRAAEMGRPR